MGESNEKKWFVYVGDHHEGPFTLAEIKQKIDQNTVQRTAFVWCEGMGDWKPMSDVPQFAEILAPPVAAAQPSIGVASQSQFQDDGIPPLAAVSSAQVEEKSSINIEGQSEPEVQTFSGVILREKDESSSHQTGSFGVEMQEPAPMIPDAVPHPEDKEVPKKAKKVRGGVLFYTLLPAAIVGAWIMGVFDPVLNSPGGKLMTSVVGDAFRPVSIKVLDKFPAAIQWLSPIPALEGLGQDEEIALREAAIRNLSDPNAKGDRVGVGLNRSDVVTPEFYIAANVPNGTKFEVIVVGIPDTLLNQTSFYGKGSAEIKDRVGKTNPIKSEEGRGLPRGQYQVYVYEADDQPSETTSKLTGLTPSPAKVPENIPQGKKLMVRSLQFLGGLRDQTYAVRLREFHSRLHQRAKEELATLGGHKNQLEAQLKETTAQFERLKKLKGKPPARQWPLFHQKWVKLQDELAKSYSQWTAEFVRGKFFYDSLFELVNRTGPSVSKIHEVQDQYFAGKVDLTTADIQVGEATTGARTLLDELSSKIQKAQELASNPNTMPKRDGL